MLYALLKPVAKLSMLFFCRKVKINKPEWLQAKGPLLLACNHPNSFLDSIILDTLFKAPVWSLARGDVFRNKFIARLLRAIRILPVYRTSEGPENLYINYQTFEACIEIFKKKGLVQIFSEAKCVNEWHLRPLKKGTARLAIKAWEENIPLTVLPVAINYSSFRRFGKNIFLHFGNPITISSIDMIAAEGVRHLAFNSILQTELEKIVWEIPLDDKVRQAKFLKLPIPGWKKILLFVPAITGLLLHAPLYLLIKSYTLHLTRNNDHYDSILTAFLIFIYPLYLLLLVFLARVITHSWLSLWLIIIIPFCAWAYIQLKPQLDKNLTGQFSN